MAIGIEDLDLYLTKFMDTESIINLSKINKKSYQRISKLKLYEQILMYKKSKRFFTIMVYSAQNNCTELINHLIFVEKNPLEPQIVSCVVMNCNVEILKLLYKNKIKINYSNNDIDVAVLRNNPNIINMLKWLLDHNYLKNINSSSIIQSDRLDLLIFLKENNIELLPYCYYDIDYYDVMNHTTIIVWLIDNYFIESAFIRMVLKLSNFRRNDSKKINLLMLDHAIKNNLVRFENFLNEVIKNYC